MILICQAVRVVAHDMVTVVFAPVEQTQLRFEAGQFVDLEFDVDGLLISRCYTISSPPTRPDRLAITVRRTEGVVSRWIHDGGVTPGTKVRSGAPQGAFTLEEHPAQSYLLLTAGSGITPALSMLRRLYDLAEDRDLVLVHSHRTEVPYREELDAIAWHLPGVRVHYTGRLTAQTLSELVPDAAQRTVLACGPAGYRLTARQAVGTDRFHEESFTVEASAKIEPREGVFRVEFRRHGVTVDCPADTTVLAAATRAGLNLPLSCAQGLCGTCKSTIVTGTVDMRHNGGIRPREIAAGRFLPCCSTPTADLVIED
jgi:ferredoxin-NADP reductase